MIATSNVRPAGAPTPAWGHALANRGFRWLLLGVAGVPIGVAYLWFGLLKPLYSSGPSDFTYQYLVGAGLLSHGLDPYLCNTGPCGGLAHYPINNPPLVYWVIQPLTSLDARAVAAIALVAANVLLFAFLYITLRALRVRDRQLILLILLGSISFAPTITEIGNRNFQAVLLVLSAVMLAAWIRGNDSLGGVALGIGIAIKIVQAPLLLLGLWGRAITFTAAAVAAWAVLWLLAVPQYLTEYVTRVLPAQAQGFSAALNDAPFGSFNRLLHPESLYNSGLGGGIAVLGLAAVFGVVVLALSWWRLRVPRADAEGRALEVAVAVAVAPLLVTNAYAGQFILLLLPMIVLVNFGMKVGSRWIVAGVASSWVLLGPVYLAFTNALAAGFGAQLILQLWANSAVAGVIVLWATSLFAIKLVDLRGVEPLTS